MNEKETTNSNEVANEWAPDEEVSRPAVTLIDQPYSDLNSTFDTLKIREDQAADQDDADLSEATDLIDELTEELPELKLADDKTTEEQLSDLSQAMEAHHEQELQELELLAKKLEAEAQQELADQIEEDLALQQEEAALAAEEANATPITEPLSLGEIQSCIETFLFLSDRPISPVKLKEYLGEAATQEQVNEAIQLMQSRYQATEHGMEIVEIAGGFQFRTKAIRADLARRMVKVQAQRLSKGAMETLAIISYKQPTLKEDVDSVRGVDSAHFIRTLMEKNLIQVSGRSDLPGRPILYTTTDFFLEVFGLAGLNALPPLAEIEAMVPMSESAVPDHDAKAAKIRKLVNEMAEDPTRLQYSSKEDELFLKEIKERVKDIAITTPYIESLNQPAQPAVIPPAATATAAAPAQGELI